MKRSERITFAFTEYCKMEYDTLPEPAKKQLHLEIEEIVGRYCHTWIHYDKSKYVGGKEE